MGSGNRMLEFYEEAFERLLDGDLNRCESPIERMFLIALATTSMGVRQRDIEKRDADACRSFGLEACDSLIVGGMLVFVNHPVGKYRADLLIVASAGPKHFLVVVELDGHDFHERTKEQAARDKKRDRWMQTQGIRVLRFTGSEVYADPFNCVDQLYDLISAEYEMERRWSRPDLYTAVVP